MKQLIKKSYCQQHGATMVEYAIMLIVVAIFIFSFVANLGTETQKPFASPRLTNALSG